MAARRPAGVGAAGRVVRLLSAALGCGPPALLGVGDPLASFFAEHALLARGLAGCGSGAGAAGGLALRSGPATAASGGLLIRGLPGEKVANLAQAR
jgi:hypothetical protein